MIVVIYVSLENHLSELLNFYNKKCIYENLHQDW